MNFIWIEFKMIFFNSKAFQSYPIKYPEVLILWKNTNYIQISANNSKLQEMVLIKSMNFSNSLLELLLIVMTRESFSYSNKTFTDWMLFSYYIVIFRILSSFAVYYRIQIHFPIYLLHTSAASSHFKCYNREQIELR